MTPDNFARAYRTFHRRVPFQPYTIELISGARLEVSHPEAVTLYEEMVIVQSSRGPRSVFEYESVVRFIDMTGTT
jgi:hypothetical protein